MQMLSKKGLDVRDIEIEYKIKRRKYNKLIRDKKQKSWEKYVEMEFGKSPWNNPYKIAMEKRKPRQVAAAIGCEGVTWLESSRVLLDTLIIDDNEIGEEEYHWNIRNEVRRNRSYSQEIKLSEVETIVKNLKNNKAP
ncbi:hypothetical protein J437_LFUL007398 [Ladona fulva]|uniref:Uncharacterized protein n=1 Tax=Ladona fulva TaxID=123851 RepID=A0A8K0NXZ3_LADFU|nr:hypothetical protein J437_LFUL007398 [Ladona fulva]